MSRQSDLAEAQCAEDGGCTLGPESRCEVCGQATTPPLTTSYDEYLITQAGGDGDPLDAIQRRITDCKMYTFGMRNADALAHFDAPFLLALARKQAATLAAVLELANARGRCGWNISSDEIRKALEA